MGLIVKRRVTLDLSRRGHQVTVPFSVGDRVAHEVIFTLRDGSELIELPPGVTAAITIKNGYKYTDNGTDNGTGCVDACVIDHVNNTITYTPTVEALSIEGNIECTLHVFDADGAVIGAPTFIFAVSEGDNANTEREVKEALEKSTGWDIIAETVSKATAAAKSAKDAEDYANRAKTALGNATLKASEAEASAAAALAHQRTANINATNAEKSAGEAAKSAGKAAEQAAAQVLEKTNENAGRAEAAANRAKETEEHCDEVLLGVSEMRDGISVSLQEAQNYAGSANDAYLFAQQEANRATEYITSRIVNDTGYDDEKVMSQKASTYAFVGRSEVNSYIIEEIAKIVADAPTDFDTLKEIADYIASDKTNAAEINSKLSKHEKEILDNKTAIENLPELVQETGDRTDAVMSQKAVTDALSFHYAEYNVPVVYFYGDVAAMTKDTAVTLNYNYGDRSGTCTLKWQGSSSIAYPKKNYTVKFDNAFEAVSGWGVQKKYCLKADWVDFSHCRNVVSAKLWGDVVRSRAASDLVTRLSALPNCGAIDGFPCFVVINDEWQGIFNFNIPKDDWMMGMGSGTKEAILCCEGTSESDASAFKAEATLGVEFELEYSSDGWAESDIQNSLNTLIRAVMNSDGTDIDTTIAQYLDIDSAIDYMLFSQLLGHNDGNYKNYILATYDGTKWFLSAYDMDNVFGFHFPGRNVDSASIGMLWCLNNKLFDLLYKHKFEALRDRLNELLTKKHTVQGVGNFYDGVMSLAQVTEKLTDYGLQIPLPAYVADAEKWNTIPSTYLNNVPQAVSWYGQRVDVLTKQYKEPEVYRGTKGIRYSTLYATCYGTGGSYVDTDIILPSEPSVYAIAGDAGSFMNNTFIESVVVPNNYKIISSSAFNGCSSLRKIELPDTITALGWGCFQGCTSLKGVRLPNNLTSVDQNIFRNCTKLSRVHLSRIPKITNNFFESCTALTDIYYDGTMAEWNALPKGSGWNTNTGNYTIHCTDGDVAKA